MGITITNYPTIWIEELREAVELQYNCKIKDIRTLMFGENFMNDTYIRYWFDELEEYTGESWQNEEDIRFRNLINTYLQDILPGCASILINVTW